MRDEILMRLPFSYEVEVVLPPRRKPERAILKGYADVMLPSVSGEDAPEAIRLVRHDIPARYPSFSGPAPQEVYRTFEGRLYTALGAGKPVPVEDFQRDVATRDAWRRGGRFAYSRDHAERNGLPAWHRESYPLKSPRHSSYGNSSSVLTALTWEELKEGEPKARVLSHNRDKALAESVVALRERVLVVDGEVWACNPEREPHWLVHVDSNESRVKVSFSLTPNPQAYLSPFRLDRLEDVIDYARDVASRLGWEYAGTEIDAVVSIPAALRFDDGVGLAQTLTRAMRRLPVAGLPADEIGRVLREIQESVRGDGTFDAAWAGRVFAGFASLSDLGGLGLAFEPGERDLMHGRLAYERWSEREASRRPDIVSLGHPDLDEDDVKSLGF